MQVIKKERSFVKIFSFVFVSLFIMAASAFAADLTVAQVSGAQGANVAVAVSMTGSSSDNVGGIQFDVNFDDAQMTLGSVTVGSAADAAEKTMTTQVIDSNTVRCVIMGFNRNVVGDGAVAQVNLAIKADAAPGTYDVSLTAIQVSNIDAQAVQSGNTPGSVTVTEGTTPPTDVCGPATLTEVLALHVPELIYETLLGDFALWVDFEYMPQITDRLVFNVAGFDVIDNFQNDPSCAYATLSNNLDLLHLPQVNYQTLLGDIEIWVDFQYFNNGDNNFLFEVVDFGVIN